MIQLDFKIFILTVLFFGFAQCNIIIKPTKTSGIQAAYVFVQGASIPANNYQLYAKQIQAKFNGSLWVALTSFPGDIPEPLLINQIMNSAFDSLRQSGLNFNKQTPFFFGGHSLGGIMVQNYLFGSLNSLPFEVTGLVLEGSFISRSNVDKLRQSGLTVLTLGAELDGLARITRIAESFHMLDAQSTLTLVLPGMNHFQFSGEGNPPPNVVKNDIKPELTNEQARDQLTSVLVAFLHEKLDILSPQDSQLLSQSAQFTKQILTPLIEALKLEGFYHFVPPCSQNSSLKPPNCSVGSEWTVLAQQTMSSLDESCVVVQDTLRSVVAIPEKFPSFNNKCNFVDKCVVNVSTITENVYSLLDGFDVGLDPIAATERRTKMESRQSMIRAYTNKTIDFNATDVGNRCGEINQLALSYAVQNVPQKVLQRYLNSGVQLRIGNDAGPFNNGFLWITNALVF
jgi:hypothetical protein